MVIWIVAAEVAFWIVIILGLAFRYLLKMPKISIFFFACTPVIDLLLIVLTVFDLKSGTAASTAHGVAAIYVGVSIAYGKTMINWADQQFQKWVLKVPIQKKRLVGWEKGKYELHMVSKHIIAFMIGAGLLYAMIHFLQSSTNTSVLINMIKIWGIILLIDAAIGLSYVVFPNKEKKL